MMAARPAPAQIDICFVFPRGRRPGQCENDFRHVGARHGLDSRAQIAFRQLRRSCSDNRRLEQTVVERFAPQGGEAAWRPVKMQRLVGGRDHSSVPV